METATQQSDKLNFISSELGNVKTKISEIKTESEKTPKAGVFSDLVIFPLDCFTMTTRNIHFSNTDWKTMHSEDKYQSTILGLSFEK